MENLTVSNAVKGRHAIRMYDPNVKIPRKVIEEMIELAMQAPSSNNLQPWRFVIIDDESTKEKLKGHMFGNERQRATSAALFLILSDNQHPDYLDYIMQKNVELGYMPQEIKDRNTENTKKLIESMPEKVLIEQGKMDTAMAAMQLMLIAREYGYETSPMGGFERKTIMEILNIDTNRYTPIMMMAIGKGAKAPHLTSRLSVEDVITYNESTDGNVGKQIKE